MFDCRAAGADGYNEPEMSHPKYNGFKRAVTEAGLEGPLLKGTLMSQFKHQPFMSLNNAKNLKQSLRFKLQLRLPLLAILIYYLICLISKLGGLFWGSANR